MTRTFTASMLLALTVPSFAASVDSARGTLVVQGEDKPLSVELKHAHLVIGPDTFETGKTTRRLVFTADDLHAMIKACTEIRCATMIASDGLVLELDAASTRYWAHVRPMQYSGSLDRGGLVLRTDKPDQVAGTVKLNNSGVTTTIEFDAALVKTFAASP